MPGVSHGGWPWDPCEAAEVAGFMLSRTLKERKVKIARAQKLLVERGIMVMKCIGGIRFTIGQIMNIWGGVALPVFVPHVYVSAMEQMP